jgi:hypothetical protein
VVAQAAGGERERVARIARLGRRLPGQGGETGFAVGGGEDAVFVKPCFARRFAFAQRPLLRALCVEPGPGEASDVEVAAAGGLAVFEPDGFGIFVGKEGCLRLLRNRGQRNRGQNRISFEVFGGLGG